MISDRALVLVGMANAAAAVVCGAFAVMSPSPTLVALALGDFALASGVAVYCYATLLVER